MSARAIEQAQKQPSLAELALVFLKLGTVAFGGPAAHIAMMQQEFVEKRQWLSQQEFLDRLAAANLIPGPSSTELAIFVGLRKRGWRGLIVAGACFILPAALIVTAIAYAYVRFGGLPITDRILYAVKPVVIAVILQAFWNLAKSAVKSVWMGVVGVAAATLFLLGAPNLAILLAAGIAATVTMWRKSAATALALFTTLGATGSPTLTRIFAVFVKIGSVLFGSGYVLLAFLTSELVTKTHWLTEKQILDAVAVGQVTPGPVFTTATFIGYLLAGGKGATVATIGIFVPAFVLVAISGPIVPKIRRSRFWSTFLDGIVVGSLALIGAVSYQLGRAALIDLSSILIAVASLVLLVRWRTNSAWLVLAAAAYGFLTAH